MKISGQTQAELVKAAMIGAAVIGGAWYLRRQVGSIADSIGDAATAATSAGKRGANAALDVVTMPGTNLIAQPPFIIPSILVSASQKAGLNLNVFNPLSNENYVNQGVSWIGRKATGTNTWTLGGWLYDITH